VTAHGDSHSRDIRESGQRPDRRRLKARGCKLRVHDRQSSVINLRGGTQPCVFETNCILDFSAVGSVACSGRRAPFLTQPLGSRIQEAGGDGGAARPPLHREPSALSPVIGTPLRSPVLYLNPDGRRDSPASSPQDENASKLATEIFRRRARSPSTPTAKL